MVHGAIDRLLLHLLTAAGAALRLRGLPRGLSEVRTWR